MKTAYIYPTFKCNLSCEMCVSKSPIIQKEEMSLEKYYELIDKLYKNGFRIFDISGGEPFLRQDLDLILRRIKKYKDTKVIVVSNGTIIAQKADDCKQALAYVDELHISIDSDIQEVHDYLRGKEKTFQYAITAIDIVKKEFNDIKVYVNTVIMKENMHRAKQILYLAQKYKCSGVYFLRKIEENSGCKKEIENIDYGKLMELIEEWIEDNATSNFSISICLPGYCFYNQKIKKSRQLHVEFDPFCGCTYGKTNIVVTSNGDVTGCTAFIHDSNMHAGNIQLDSWEDIFENISRIHDRIKSNEKNIHSKGMCATCTYWKICRGGCPISYTDEMRGNLC